VFLGEEAEVYLLYDLGLARVGGVVAIFLLAGYFVGVYDQMRVESRTFLVQQVCFSLGVVFLAQAAMQYLKLDWAMPRKAMFLGAGMSLFLVPAWRILYSDLVTKSLAAERILFLGASPTVLELSSRLAELPELGLKCVGHLLADGETEPGDPGAFHAPLARLREVVEKTKPDRLVVGLVERRQTLPIYDLLDLRFSGIRIDEVASLYETVFHRVCINELRPAQLIFSSTLGPHRRNLLLQSWYSALIAATGILLSGPLMILAAVAIKLSSPGPVLFRQTRVGFEGKPFTVYKFRSMRTDAEAETGAVWAAENDPRVTGVGRWLRRFRLDELPQLFNVLKGEMAIVGPRPERPEFVRTLTEQIPFYSQRHSVRPGITGWAQINYKYGNNIEDSARKLEYDLYYIKNVSAWLDFYIMFDTIRAVLSGRGAQ
jgi:sugar transferase (PEP-CTERM system associated)